MPGDAAESGTEPGAQPQAQVEGQQVEAGADQTAPEAGAAEVAIEAGTTPDPWALGHVVLAPDASVTASFFLLLALAAGVGASVVGLGLALVRRGVGAELNKRAVAVVIGLAVAILAFPGAANELGAAAFEGSQASLRVLPASVDVGLRCAFADAPTQSAAA